MNLNKLIMGVNFCLYLLSIALFISIPDERVLNYGLSISAFLMSTFLIIYNREKVKRFCRSFWFQNMSSTFISVILICSILGLINYISYKHPQHLDLTKNQNNSLTDQSQKIVKSITKNATITIFSRKQHMEKIQVLFELYRQENPNISINSIDVALRPDLVKLHGIERVPAILVKMNNRKELLYRIRELEVTNALIKLNRVEQPTICVTSDHGELSLTNTMASGGSILKEHLVNSTYRILQISTLKAIKIADSCQVLSIMGPSIDFSLREISMFSDFLEKGGSLLVALNPMLNGDKVENFRSFLRDYGINIKNNMVIDINQAVRGSKGTVPLVTEFEQNHEISPFLMGPLFFPLVSSITKSLISSADLKFTSIIKSGAGSWGEETIKELMDDKLVYNEDVDEQGPLTMVAAIDNVKTGARIFALGNSSLITNVYQKYSTNFKMILNSISWLNNQGLFMSFKKAGITDSPVFIGRPQIGIIFYFSVVFTPLLLLVMAIYFYRRRLSL